MFAPGKRLPGVFDAGAIGLRHGTDGVAARGRVAQSGDRGRAVLIIAVIADGLMLDERAEY